MKMILVNKRFLSIEVNKDAHCLIQHWRGHIISAEFREGILASLDIFKQQGLIYMISDTQSLQVVKKVDADFAASTIPEFVEAGLKAFAFVVPYSIFTQSAVDNFSSKSSDYLQIEYFEELEQAKEWIKNIL